MEVGARIVLDTVVAGGKYFDTAYSAYSPTFLGRTNGLLVLLLLMMMRLLLFRGAMRSMLMPVVVVLGSMRRWTQRHHDTLLERSGFWIVLHDMKLPFQRWSTPPHRDASSVFAVVKQYGVLFTAAE